MRVVTMRVVVVLGVVAVLGNVGLARILATLAIGAVLLALLGVALVVTGGGIAQLGVLLGGVHDLVLRVLGVLLLARGLPGGRGFLVHGVAEHVAQVGSHLRGGTRGRRVRAVVGPVLRV